MAATAFYDEINRNKSNKFAHQIDFLLKDARDFSSTIILRIEYGIMSITNIMVRDIIPGLLDFTEHKEFFLLVILTML